MTSEDPRPDLLASIRRSPNEAGVEVAHCRNLDIRNGSSRGYFIGMSPLEATIFSLRPGPTQQPLGSSAGVLQAKQLGWEHSSTYQETGCLSLPEHTAIH